MSDAAQRLSELATSYWGAGAVNTAAELGLFARLAHPATADEVAAAAGTAPRHTGALLHALAGLGVLDQAAGRFCVAEAYRPSLLPDSPTNLLGALRYNRDLAALWQRLPDGIRSGQPVLPPTAHLGADAARTRAFVLGMHSRALAFAPHLVRALDLRGARRLLDIGAGPGTFARACAVEHPHLEAVLFDLPAVLDIARELTDASPVHDRVTLHPGDYRADPLPRGCDTALYCGALHQESPASALALFQALAAVLPAGGQLFVVDMLLEADRSHPVFSALFSLNMLLTSPRGQVFSVPEAAAALGEAGFDVMEHIACLPGCPYGLLRARRPGGTP